MPSNAAWEALLAHIEAGQEEAVETFDEWLGELVATKGTPTRAEELIFVFKLLGDWDPSIREQQEKAVRADLKEILVATYRQANAAEDPAVRSEMRALLQSFGLDPDAGASLDSLSNDDILAMVDHAKSGGLKH